MCAVEERTSAVSSGDIFGFHSFGVSFFFAVFIFGFGDGVPRGKRQSLEVREGWRQQRVLTASERRVGMCGDAYLGCST